MVLEGKEQAIEHLLNAQVTFIALLVDVQGGLAEVLLEHVNRTADGSYFEYNRRSKGLKFKIEGENNEQVRQAAEDDEVKEPKEGKTYVATLICEGNTEVFVQIDPNDIVEIIQSAPDEETITY
ncbi:unnamed protein product [Rotaria magnacalcarata]|uniref:Uncharacterized protein n=1 Tax=Rotaria magnacalcarata TaxID=392030 RepID=A0A816M2N6_9BILA|nr:unnamed protein product [Rotaria magnacalcarata]CAF2077426.1 unnamed protein product [Rotaria magnacalcarata]CAF3793292.1 unnamed protein product [Rotaria magnacalcarata]CAF3860750.1 unnamed protein product [Rotaria magnacalcarata]